MSILLSLLPAGFAILVADYLIRALYRFVFRKRILERLERAAVAQEVQAIGEAIKANHYSTFEQQIHTVDAAFLNAVSWDKEVLSLLDCRVIIERFERENPTAARAHLLTGTFATFTAWEARGSGYASSVTKEAFKQFDALLHDAEVSLQKAIELDPELVPAYRGLLQVYKGLGRNAAADATFAAAKKIAPANLGYHLTRLDHLNTKWGGSEEKMFAFARECPI